MPTIKKNGLSPKSVPSVGANAADDAFQWIAGNGAWGDAGNWKDITTGANPATTPPGRADSATIKGPGGSAFHVISGPGSAAMLTLSGNNILEGQFNTGSLTQAGTLLIDTDSTLSATSAVLGSNGFGSIADVNGATLRISGTLALAETLVVLNSGTVQADTVMMTQGPRVDSSSVFEVGTAGTAAPGAVTVDSGAVLSMGSSGQINVAVVDNGTIIANSFSVPLIGGDEISGSGTLEISNGSNLRLFTVIGSGIDVLFAANTGNLQIESRLSQGETISGFSNGNAIDLIDAQASNVSYAPGDNGIGTLTATNDGTPVTSLKLAGDYTDASFFVIPDGGNGTNIVVVCFCEGTRISTPTGETPVEQLAVGDRVLTLQGEARPIVWIGTGHVPASRHASDIVIVRKGALDDNVPCRDLRVTKGHSLFVDGVLVPVEFLINNRTILRDEQAREVTIYHVELATHDVLIADGAPAESYRDDGNRRLFQNANPGWKHRPKEPCARVLNSGPIVDLIWRRLRDRANAQPGLTMTGEPDLHLVVDGRRIDAIDRSDARYVFQIAARPRSVHIRSRCAAPQALGVSKDPRMLGVAIQRIVLAHARRQRAIAADAASLTKGYHAFEADFGIRWTDGDAVVPADLFAGMSTPGLLMLHIGGAAMYPDHASSSPGV